jgi:hypothetical protein
LTTRPAPSIKALQITDGGLQASRADSLLAFVEEGPHRGLVDGKVHRATGIPSVRDPLRLVNQFPRVDNVGMKLGDARQRIERLIEKIGG